MIFLALLLGNHPGVPGQEQDEKAPISAFVVCPVETDLQRLFLVPPSESSPPVKTFVAIDGSAGITRDGLLDPASVPAAAVRKALGRVPDRENGTVAVRLYFSEKRHSSAATDLLKALFEGVGRCSGFKATQMQTSVTVEFGNEYWKKTFEALTINGGGREEEDETPAGGDLVKVYPVRRALSRLLTGNVDCVIDILPSLEPKGNRLLSPEVRDAIVKNATAMTFRDKGRVLFRINSETERLSGDRFKAFRRTEAPELAQKLGFKDSHVQVRW